MVDRYARHIALPQVGNAGQQKISAGSVLLVGVGGIGCAAASYLASSGVGRLLISDFDTVDVTNLGRQVLYSPADVGKRKVEVAAARLAAINPDVDIEPIDERLAGDRLVQAVQDSDVVLDGSDNFATRFKVNDACVAAGRTLISGAAIRLEGQLAVFGPDYLTSACYRCLYTDADESLDNCAGNGVLAPLPAVIGSMMAAEALKFLAELPMTIARLNLFDAAANEFRTVSIQKKASCSACGTS